MLCYEFNATKTFTDKRVAVARVGGQTIRDIFTDEMPRERRMRKQSALETL